MGADSPHGWPLKDLQSRRLEGRHAQKDLDGENGQQQAIDTTDQG